MGASNLPPGVSVMDEHINPSEPPWKDCVEIGDATLYLGDCTDIMPFIDHADTIITSPPYNIKGGTHAPSGMFSENRCGARKISGDWYEDAMDEGDYWEWINHVVSLGIDTTKGGLVWVNHKVRYENRKAIHPAREIKQDIYCEVIWDRGGSITLNANKFAPSHEQIWAFGVPSYWNSELNTSMSVWRIAPQVDKDHPCPFPPKIPSKIIAACVPENGIVLDPFMGSGTTGVACADLGRRFIGIELDPKYFDLSCQRIESAYAQGRLFK